MQLHIRYYLRLVHSVGALVQDLAFIRKKLTCSEQLYIDELVSYMSDMNKLQGKSSKVVQKMSSRWKALFEILNVPSSFVIYRAHPERLDREELMKIKKELVTSIQQTIFAAMPTVPSVTVLVQALLTCSAQPRRQTNGRLAIPNSM